MADAAVFVADRFDRDAFLRDYWQQRPLLIRNPWRNWQNPLEPDELAGLACEDEIESRLVFGAPYLGKAQTAAQWRLEHGPFPETHFAKLPTRDWTLLVQAVDHYLLEVAALIEPFRFIPNWRIDDVMVSYAVDGGSVGPHFDQYDVFLIQGLGKRRWQIGVHCDSATPLLPHDELRLLAEFEASEEWVLEPGDILYVPPGYAHNGVAVGDDCMTYSIGFRAPSRAELLGSFADYQVADLEDDDRYGDAGIVAATNPGEIDAHALHELHAMALETLQDTGVFRQWFGRFSTARKYPEQDQQPEDQLSIPQFRQLLREAVPLRNPASRFAFIRAEDGGLTLFVDGEAYPCDATLAPLAERLCAHPGLEPDAATLQSEPALALLLALYHQGSLVFEDDA
jgi:50S ribosomal protein L16 3-hydroxylase